MVIVRNRPGDDSLQIAQITKTHDMVVQRGVPPLKFYCLVSVRSRGPRPASNDSFIELPETLPEYLIVTAFPPISRFTSNETLSPSTLPFLISAAPPRPPSTVPVSAEPLCFNVNV